MWQVAVAAAVAGSGLLAKRIFSPSSSTTSIPTEPESEPLNNLNQNISNHFSDLNSINNDTCNGEFRFSSSPSASKKHPNTNVDCLHVGNQTTSNNNKNKNNKSKNKKVGVSLKRRKISHNANNSPSLSSLSQDCSSFGWGLGLGMICMMSAGKAEISKLSCTIDETAKVVNELKSELNKEKSVPCNQPLSFVDSGNTLDTIQKPGILQENNEPCLLSKHPIDTKLFSHLVDSEYASSVLTEEHQHEGAEMDQLEAELESELQKLPWCTLETSKDGNNTQMNREAMNQSSSSYCCDGVNPAELGNKLSTLLMEQQESQISELECELNSAYSKLQEKESELQKLKECVRRLTEFSLSTVSDEETEAFRKEPGELDRNIMVLADNAIVGTKRAMHFS